MKNSNGKTPKVYVNLPKIKGENRKTERMTTKIGGKPMSMALPKKAKEAYQYWADEWGVTLSSFYRNGLIAELYINPDRWTSAKTFPEEFYRFWRILEMFCRVQAWKKRGVI